MPIYSVDTVAVADTAARTRTRIATIQTEVDAMRGDIGLLQSCWTGTAADSMATCAADWHLTQLQVQSNLDQISLALDNAAVCYDDAETANQGRFATPGTTTAPATAPGPWPLGRSTCCDLQRGLRCHPPPPCPGCATSAHLSWAHGASDEHEAAGRPSRV